MFKNDEMYNSQLLPTASSIIKHFYENGGFELSTIINHSQYLGIKQAQIKGYLMFIYDLMN